jgi:hypothetical protein
VVQEANVKMKKTYQAHVSTPEEDATLAELREGLQAWLKASADKGIEHGLVLAALMLFSASGAAATDVSREAFVDLMGKYFDVYRENFKTLS